MKNKNKENREIEREILKRKQQLEEIDRKMHQVKRQAERDIGNHHKIGIPEIIQWEVENL